MRGGPKEVEFLPLKTIFFFFFQTDTFPTPWKKEGFSAVYFVVEIAAETVKEKKAFLTNDDYKDRDDMVRRYVFGAGGPGLAQHKTGRS